MFILNGKRFNIYQRYTDPVSGESGIDMSRPENRARFGVTEIPDPVRGDDNLFYNQEINDAPYLIMTPKPQAQVDAYLAAVQQVADDTAAREAAKVEPVIQALVDIKSLAQCNTFSNNNFPSLTAPERAVMAKIIFALSVLAKDKLR